MKEMIEIETYYLIDYENVGSEGLFGCYELNKSDHIIIFFTKNARKIDMSEIANHGDADLNMIEVPSGKQSIDIHIGSYLGYLAGINKGKDCRIVIISKDTDYDNVIKFWKTQTGVKSSRAQQIKASTSKATIAKQAAVSKKSSSKASGAEKTKLNQEVMQAVRAAGFDAKAGNSVAQLVVGLYGKDRFMNEVHNALKDKYPDYIEMYRAIKSTLSKYTDTIMLTSEKATNPDKTNINNRIIQLLSKAGFKSDIVGYVASTVVKNVGVKNGKQQIYKTLTSEYGQNKGLNIYNQIKKHI